MDEPSYLDFDKSQYPWRPDVDYRAHPEEYRVGKGEQGVLICEPYKSELVGLWRFKTPQIALESSAAVFAKFESYLASGYLSGPIWLVNSCRWGSRELDVTQTTKAARST